MFGLGYLTAFGISISMVMLGDWVKGCKDDINGLKKIVVKEKESVDEKENKVD